MPAPADPLAWAQTPHGKRALLTASARYFITQVFGYTIADHHEKILQHIEGRQQTLDLCPRGSGKTRIATIGYAAWRAACDPNIRILIVSDTDTHAVRFLATIKAALEHSPAIVQAFGSLKGPVWSDHGIVLKGRTKILTEATITALGMYSGAVTSGHYDLILCDDLATLENSRTDAGRERSEDWLLNTLLPTLLPGGELHFVGTRYHYLDLYQVVIDQLKLHTQVQAAIQVDEEGHERSIWEAFMPLEDRLELDGRITEGLRTLREKYGPVPFALQFQNDVALMKAGEIYNAEWFRYYEVITDEEGEDWVACPDGKSCRIRDLERWVGVDPAVSKTSVADYFALVVIGYWRTMQRYFVLQIIRGKFTYDQRGRLINQAWTRWKPRGIGIEDNSAQADYIARIREEYPFIRTIGVTTVTDKVSRAYNRAGLVENGRMWVRRSMGEFVDELVLMPDGEHDDMFDGWDMALHISRTTSGALVQQRRDGKYAAHKVSTR